MRRSRAKIEKIEPSTWAPLLTRSAFALTLALVMARAMMSETVRESLEVMPGSSEVPRGPGAGAGLILDALCCLPALLVLVRRALDRQYSLRWTWAQILFGALATWAGLSALWSADKYV